MTGPGSTTANSRGVYLDTPVTDAYCFVQGNTIIGFQRAYSAYAGSALAVNKLFAVANNIANDTTSSSRDWTFEGSATKGTEVCVVWSPSNIGLRDNNIDSASNARLLYGTGSPEGGSIAGIGSIYFRTDGGANTTLYIKESGTGNTGWVTLGSWLSGSATFDPANLVDGAGETTTVTVTGAALGDFAEASFSNNINGITLTAWVSAADTVSVRFQNESGGTLDLASGTLRARVRKA